MPRYFFHVTDGRSIPDTEGTELADFYQAQYEAIQVSGELLRDMGAKFWQGTEWKMEVADARGQIVFVLRFSAEERPVLDGDVPIDGGLVT